MTLYVGRHMIGMSAQRDEKGEVVAGEWSVPQPIGESGVEYEIVDMSGSSSQYIPASGAYDEIVWLKMRKVK